MLHVIAHTTGYRLDCIWLITRRSVITEQFERFVFQNTLSPAKLVIIALLLNINRLGKTMRILSIFALLLTFTTAAFAQSAMDEQIALARQSANADRQAILMGNMQFKADEAAEFWPAWKAYRAASKANGDRLLNLIRDFAMNYESMTDLKANELMTDYFSIRMQDLVIKQQFAKKIDVFLPAQKVMRVIQIENKLDAAIQMQLASEIPLTR